MDGWPLADVCREHIFRHHIFKEYDRNQCREKDCQDKFRTPKDRARHEKEKHPILYYWDDHRWNASEQDTSITELHGLNTSGVTISVVSAPNEPSTSGTNGTIEFKMPEKTPVRIANTQVMTKAELEAIHGTARPQVYIPEFLGDEQAQEAQRNLWLRQFVKSHPTPDNFRSVM